MPSLGVFVVVDIPTLYRGRYITRRLTEPRGSCATQVNGVRLGFVHPNLHVL